MPRLPQIDDVGYKSPDFQSIENAVLSESRPAASLAVPRGDLTRLLSIWKRVILYKLFLFQILSDDSPNSCMFQWPSSISRLVSLNLIDLD